MCNPHQDASVTELRLKPRIPKWIYFRKVEVCDKYHGLPSLRFTVNPECVVDFGWAPSELGSPGYVELVASPLPAKLNQRPTVERAVSNGWALSQVCTLQHSFLSHSSIVFFSRGRTTALPECFGCQDVKFSLGRKGPGEGHGWINLQFLPGWSALN